MHQFFSDDLGAFGEADVFIVPINCLGGGREQWLGQTIRITQTGWQFDTTYRAVVLIVLPTAASNIAPRNALDGYNFGFTTQHDAALKGLALSICQARHICHVGADQMMVDLTGKVIKPKLRDLSQHHALTG